MSNEDSGGGFLKVSGLLAMVASIILQKAEVVAYNDPVRVIVFNTDEEISRDVSAEIAYELIERTADQPDDLPECLANFVDRHGGLQRPVQLSLPTATH